MVKEGLIDRMNAKRWIALSVVAALIVISLGFRFVTTIAEALFFDSFDLETELLEEEVLVNGDSSERIAVLNLNGTIQHTESGIFVEDIYNHPLFLHMIDTAAEDPTIKGIVLQVDSPGGTVIDTAEIHRHLVDVQEQYDKPIYVSMGNMAASGGYYVAAPAEKIFAEKATMTGSIGVIMESINISELAENHGIEFNTIKSGKHKDIMSPGRKMTEEEEDIMQSMIDEMYDDFVDVIVDGRGLSESHVREVGDGRLYTGRQAVENGLVDDIGTFDDTLQHMMDDYDLNNAEVMQYDYGFGVFSSFLMSAQQAFNKGDVEFDTIMALLRESDQPRAMYIY